MNIRQNTQVKTLLLAVLMLAQATTAQDKTPPEKTPAKAGLAPTQAETTSGRHEGIKVHGHWTIVVKNPDGSIVSHKEFENALDTYQAPAFLAAVMARQQVPGYWELVASAGGVGPPCTSPVFPDGDVCYIIESKLPFSGTPTSTNLTVTSGPALILSGSFNATKNGIIDYVDSVIQVCPGTFSPSATCQNGPPILFTNANLPSAVQVQSGQQVLVKVEISFT